MLPFLKPKQMASTIIMNNDKTENKESEQPSELMAISEQLIKAIHDKDASAVASALSKLDGDDNEQE